MPMVVLCFACTESSERQGVYVLDGAGEVLRSTDLSAVERPLPWKVSDVPATVIGGSGEAEHALHRVSGAVQLADTIIAVLDGASSELRLFDASGRHLRTLGGEGDGPGEFRRPQLVPSRGHWPLVVYDRQHRRLTRIQDDLRLQGEKVGVQSSMGFADVLGILGNRMLVRSSVVGFESTQGAFERSDTVVFALVDADGLSYTTHKDPGIQMYGVLVAGQHATFAMPFDVSPSAVAGDSSYFVTGGDDATITEYDGRSGRRRQTISVVKRCTPTRPGPLAHYAEAQTRYGRTAEAKSAIRKVVQSLPIRKCLPAFDDLVLDDTGPLWVRIATEGEVNNWLVFRPDGTPLGTVSTPAGVKVLQIGDRWLVGLWRDGDGVEQIHRYALSRQ